VYFSIYVHVHVSDFFFCKFTCILNSRHVTTNELIERGCAMYIHETNAVSFAVIIAITIPLSRCIFFRIVFRDLKPDNVAFDFRGDMRLFDFGLAKELKRADLRNPPDEFNATGLTGSRRYMAPEVVQCKEYGLSADVYSFAILAWEVLSGKSAFEAMDLDKHFDLVVMKGKRPKLGKTMEMKCSKQLLVLLERMWSDDPKQRPLFKSVCEILSSQLAVEKGGASSLDSNRSQYLIARSQRSRGDAMQDDAEKDGN